MKVFNKHKAFLSGNENYLLVNDWGYYEILIQIYNWPLKGN